MGFFSKIKNVFAKNSEKTEEIKNYDKGLEKSRREFVSQLSNLSKKYKNIDDDYFEELENILIMADIGVETVMNFVDRLKDRCRHEKITDSMDLQSGNSKKPDKNLRMQDIPPEELEKYIAKYI